MTLCIAALAQHAGSPRIVLCFDSKVSSDEFSSETEYKFKALGSQLCSLFSGAPGRAKELAWIYREFLRETVLDKQSIVDQLREPIKRFKRRLANAYLGRSMGLSYEEVLQKGKDWFGEDFQKRLLNLETHPLRVDLIIAGFIGDFPVLCELRDGDLEWRTTFSLIGTGAYTAEPAMHARKHIDQTPLYSAIYNVYEAKKIGEASPHVGTFTTLLVLSPPVDNSDSTHIDVLTPEGKNHLEGWFEQFGPKPMPYMYHFPENGLQRTK